jgi:signal transduction histidine kinase/ligand-binding sensor domain-containing protein
MRTRLILLALVLYAPLAGACQELRFQHLTTDDGLSDNAVNCVYRDRVGFLWIGTERGLDRFDGQRVDPVEGSAFAIAAITDDKQGVMWAATKDNGLLMVDRASRNAERLHHVPGDPRSIASDQLTAVFDLNDTTLLLGSREHTLIFMDKRTRAFSYWTDSLSLDPAKARNEPSGRTGWCHTIAPLNDQWLWIGLLNNQCSFLVDQRTGRIAHHLVFRREGSESQTCALLHEGMLYSGGWQNGLDAFAMEPRPGSGVPWTPDMKTISTTDEVCALAQWSDGSILAGTRGHGLLSVDARTHATTRMGHRRNDASTLPSDRIRCLAVDATGILWVGTANGLAYHAPQVWRMRTDPLIATDDESQPELFFHRIEAEGSSGLRAFTSNGFYTQETAGALVKHIPLRWKGTELQPTVLLREASSMLIGTEYGFVRQRALDTSALKGLEVTVGGSYTYRPGDMYQVRHVSADTLNGTPVLVVATLGFGVHVLDAQSLNVLGSGMPPSAVTLKSRSLINDMVRDAKGTYWFASGDGIFRWSREDALTSNAPKQPLAVSHEGILAPGTAIAKLLSAGNALWAIARDGRLMRVTVDSAAAQPAPWAVNAMHGLCADRQHRLWVSTDDGLLRYDPKDGRFIRVPVNDGSSFRKLTRAIAALPDGRIALAANNTIISFDPAVFDTLPPLPLAYMSSAKAADRPVRVENERATLSYRVGVIDIGVSALAFGFPRPLTFAYRLDGVEAEWRTATAKELIRYAGVPVGEHRLLVRVQDPYGRKGPEQTLLSITVEGPFWQQWWFYALAALLISTVVFAWSRYRIAQAMKLQAVRNRIASDLHDEVGSSLSSITIGSQLAAQLSSNENVQVKQLMARIGETSSESLRSMSDIVWAIDPKNDQGEALVKRMRRIAHELLESRSVAVTFDVSGGIEELKLPMDARKELLLIYKEAVHNASKYAEASHVGIELRSVKGRFSMSVRDNGRGFDTRLHPDGNGLGNMRRRAATLRSALTVESTPGHGTYIALEVDLGGWRG